MMAPHITLIRSFRFGIDSVRSVAFFLKDVQRLSELLMKCFTPIEERLIVPDSESEFDTSGCIMYWCFHAMLSRNPSY